MSDTVIKIENLSKRYLIGHQRQPGEYQTLRDTLTHGAQRFGQRLLHPFKASSGQPMLGADEVEEFWALKDISFDVKQGDRVGIIGRNGAGKSTLLKILSRITEPTSGSVGIKGRVASLLEVGTGFHPELTGRENIFLNGAILGMSKHDIRRKFDEIVAFAEVEKFLDTPVKRYSSGMYVRLAFAVAAHLEPEILIVDEVLAVGDAQFQKKCLGKMEDVGKEGRTVIFVSHNMGAILSLCSHGFVLDKGQAQGFGPIEESVANYLGQNMGANRLPIAKRKDRAGSGKVRFSDCSLHRGSGGEEAAEFFIGDQFNANLLLSSMQPVKVWVSVVLKDFMGRKIMSSSNRLHGMTPQNINGEMKCLFNITSFDISEGDYVLDLNVYEAGSLELLDSIEEAVVFKVLPRDIYGSGFQVGSYFGMVHLQNSWIFSS